jgi:tungstate transport system permease protein
MSEMLWNSLKAGLAAIFGGDAELYAVVFVSLRCTALACLGAGALGLPLAVCLANSRFPGRGAVILFLNTLQALPTVVVGLFMYVLISRRGIFGPLDLLYSWKAIAIGQFILILPLTTMFLLAALSRLDERYRQTALTLGANPRQAAWTVLREARFAVVAALCAAFGRGIAEVGVSMMLGGNIKGYTRTMTTAMALEYDKGEFTLALALGVVLLAVSFAMNAALAFFQGKADA